MAKYEIFKNEKSTAQIKHTPELGYDKTWSVVDADNVQASARSIEEANKLYKEKRESFERKRDRKPNPFFDSLCDGGYA